MRNIRLIGICAAFALALSVVAAPSASARAGRRAQLGARAQTRAAAKSPGSGTVLVLKAGGVMVPNGALVHVIASAYFFKSKVTVEGTSKKAAKEEEVECATEYFEQGKVKRDFAANAWDVVETSGIDFCEGEEWFAGHATNHPLILSGPNLLTDESTVELFRTEEQIKEEEKQEFLAEEPIHAREPKRCVYNTVLGHGRFKSKKGGPIEAKVKGKMILDPLRSNPGCGLKAKWKANFSLFYKGQPITSALEIAPTVTSVSPAEGPTGGATTVTIGGTGFTGATAVQFGSANATSYKVNSDTSITAVAPSGSGTVDVTVTTPVTRTATTPADQFTYQPAPSVSEISPKTGPESGATEVTITGAHFTSGSAVNFGSTPAASVKVNSASSITAVSPKASGTVHVTVTTAGGTSATSSADEYTYIPGV
jgi:IPT/TIG domain